MMKNAESRLLFGLSPILLTAMTLGCGRDGDQAGTPPDAPTPATAAAVSAAPPSMDELAGATFTGILDEPVELVDGSWEGEPFVEGGVSGPAVGLVREFLLTGDVTGDGKRESVVLLWKSSGGSGTFEFIAVAGRTGEETVTLGTAELGDRVQVRQGRISDGKIELDVVQAGSDDAACCPTQMATRIWVMGPDGLTEVSSDITGTMSVAELRGPEWVLTDFAWNESAPVEPEVTLVFEEDRVAGNAGCNGYFGGLEEGGDMPSSISIGQVGATRMMCTEEIMAVEDRYLKQLAAVTSYSYLAGRLALSWQNDRASGVMLFAQREPAIPDS